MKWRFAPSTVVVNCGYYDWRLWEARLNEFESAARLTTSVPEQNYLHDRAARLGTARTTAPATPGDRPSPHPA
jgi:hypothetical protein